MPMVSKSTPSTKPATEKTSAIKRCRIYRWLRLMSTKENLYGYIQRRWRLLSILVLYVFFRPAFEGKLASLLESFESSWGSFIIWLILIYSLMTPTFHHNTPLRSKIHPLCKRCPKTLVIILLGGWFYYRFIGASDYIPTSTPIPWICYIDIFLVICICLSITKHKSYKEEKKKLQSIKENYRKSYTEGKQNGYLIDQPITAKDEDLLGRRDKANALADRIFHTNTSEATFTLGLTAPWGAGKTSFMLAMEEHLKKQYGTMIILWKFNPWLHRKAPNLTQVFFEELSNTLSPYNSDLASNFTHYVNSILAKEDNMWVQLSTLLLPQSFKAKNVGEQYESLKQEIRQLRRKIFVFIDDVDRLDSEELTELFCLVRNISPFPNMSYILAYDKEYVATQLQKKFDKHTYRYMEKIVQVEYPLAKITPEQLEKAITDIFYSMGDKYIALKEYLDSSHLQLVHHLPSLRSIKHIHNCLLSLPNELQEKVRLFDWFIIELLRIQYPRLFEFLKENYVRAFDCDANWRVIMEIGEDSDHTHSHSALMFDHQTYGEIIHFREYLSLHREELQIENIDLALELMIKLWGKSREVADGQANSWNYIEGYLYRTISDSSIVKYHKSITPSLRQPIQLEMVRLYIEQESCDYNGFSTLLYRLLEENPIGIEETTYMLDVAFCALSTDRFFKYFSLSGTDMFIIRNDESDARYMKDRIDSWINSTRLLNDQYPRAVLHNPDAMRGVLRYLSWAINCEIGINIPFNLETLEATKEDLFLQYLEQNQASPIDYYRLWFQCQTRIKVAPDGSHEITDEPIARLSKMDDAIRAVIRNNIKELIPCFIQKKVGIEDPQYKILLPNLIFTLDKNKKSPEVIYFPDLIQGLDGSSSSNIEEFLEFFDLWKKDDSAFIHFEFKHIIPANLEKEECQ